MMHKVNTQGWPLVELPLEIVPSNWWVAKDWNGKVWCYECRPCVSGLTWSPEEGAGDFEKLPPWIAAQLPAAWHALPWDQSAVQQKEGGEA